MAKAKQTSKIFGAATGALMAAVTALSPTASFAQEATPAAQPFDENLWTQEAWDLHQASKSAHTYVRTTNNAVGIVFHIGGDLRDRAQAAAEKYNIPAEHAMQVMLNRLEEDYAEKYGKLGIEIEMFPNDNPGSQASGVSYVIPVLDSNNEIKTVTYEDPNKNAVLNLGEANDEIKRVAQAVSYAQRHASVNTATPDEPAL